MLPASGPGVTCFGFPVDEAAAQALRYIPMSVRFALDQEGVTIALSEWQLLPLHARRQLVQASVAASAADAPDAQDAAAFRALLDAAMRQHLGKAPARLDVAPDASWREVGALPAAVLAQYAWAGLAPAAPEAWRRLPPLARYTLAKMSRKPRPNEAFRAALAELRLA
ncbi:nitrate reductase associated protein [Cupriavidus sp. 30B13]|uniref:nitrate reductase associated protein n=1 Tax=Cupriavidus sp. 30B13 TaxID=3384241 RepID=UPI003B8F7535